MAFRTRFDSALCTIALALAALAVAANPAAAETLPNGVASGDVTETSIVLWTRSTVEGQVRFEVATDATFERIVRRRNVRVTNPLRPVKVLVERLSPGTDYDYRVTDASGASAAGHFRTLPSIGTRRGLRFGVSGDVDFVRSPQLPHRGITNVAGRDLDFFLNIGDTIYGDHSVPGSDLPGQACTLDEFRQKHARVYSETGGVNGMADLRASTATLVTIDDHEVFNDFAGGAHPSTIGKCPALDRTGDYVNETELFSNALQAFQEYNPLADEFYGETGDPRTEGKRKLYRYRIAGDDAAFFVLDARSFRDAEVPAFLDDLNFYSFLLGAFDPSRTMLGHEQIESLKTDLMHADLLGVTWKFVMAPEPIQNLGPGAGRDRFEGYAAERSELLGFIETNDIRNVVFVSADIHGTIVNNLTYRPAQGARRIATKAFGISTGPIAKEPTLGTGMARALGVEDFYDSLSLRGKEVFLRLLFNTQLLWFGYDPIGLGGSPIDARLLEGSYSATSTWGWTEFEIDRDGRLLVTTYGIDPDDPSSTLSVVSRFRVLPQ